MLHVHGDEKREREDEEKLKTAENYYTAWAHQVKVPISAIHLILAEAEDRTRRDVGAELTRIEQYTDMIMAYVRLDSSSTDYVFREVSLDNVIKASFASIRVCLSEKADDIV